MGDKVNAATKQHTIVVIWSLKYFYSEYSCFEVDATTTFLAFEFKCIPDSSTLKVLAGLSVSLISSNKVLNRAIFS